VLLDERDWDAIRAEWDALHAASPAASSALDFTWLRNWWRVYAPTLRAHSLRVVVIRRGTELIGAIPLYLRRERGGPLGLRCLGFVSTGEAEFEETCPDYLNLLCLPGEEALCAERAWRAIESLAWDKLELLDVPADAALLGSTRAPANLQRFARGKCPIADLSGGFDAYLARLSPNSRQQVRRLLREGERAGVRLELIGIAQTASAIDDLVRLHQARWTAAGKPGVFAAPRFLHFHRELIGQQLPLDRVALARFWLGDEPFAVIYGFISGDKFEFYQSGIRHDVGDALQSPGNLAHLLLMRTLAGRGITAYDFLRGSASYKQRLATRAVDLMGAQVWRPTLRAAAYRSLRFAGRVVRRGWRLMRRSTPTPVAPAPPAGT
jgi:CelD/BcsL family acetyltransferase involved in cellulose biosynthesis